MTRRDHTFLSGGQQCAARLHTPAGSNGATPCVVMAPGFDGAEAEWLYPFAERFASAGVAALVFDYRHALIDLGAQIDDWRAAVNFARILHGIDPRRVALWGTAISAGHVLTVAAEDPDIAAAISQTPFVNGRSAMRAAGIRSSLRVATRMAIYRPGMRAAELACPWLVCVCDSDSVAPAGPALKAAARAPHSEIRHYAGAHFDIYSGPTFEMAVADQADFLRRHLIGDLVPSSAADRR